MRGTRRAAAQRAIAPGLSPLCEIALVLGLIDGRVG